MSDGSLRLCRPLQSRIAPTECRSGAGVFRYLLDIVNDRTKTGAELLSFVVNRRHYLLFAAVKVRSLENIQ